MKFVTGCVYSIIPSVLTIFMQSPLEARELGTFSGFVRAKADANLVAEVQGVIVSSPISAGTYIAEGQVVVELDSEEENLTYQQKKALHDVYEAEHNLAVRKLARTKLLIAKRSVSADQLEEAKASADSASARLAAAAFEASAAKLRLDKHKIRAPFSGVLVNNNESTGQYVRAGTRVARVVDTTDYFIDLYIQPSAPTNQSLQATIAAEYNADPGTVCSLTLHSISPAVERDTGMRLVTFNAEGCRLLVSQSIPVILSVVPGSSSP
jgi:RND family efflux transporter MFP subunit